MGAKTHLEAKNLYVSNRISSLWIAATVRDVGDGVILSNDACSLIENADEWVAVFLAEDLYTYELPGTLEELVSTISAVYDQYRRVGGTITNAFRQAVHDPDR